VLAKSDTPDDHRFHTAMWPQGGDDRFVLTSFETNATPNCQAGSGEFAVFDATRWRETGKFKEISTYVSRTDVLQRRPTGQRARLLAALVQRPAELARRRRGRAGAYDNGTQFLRVSGDGKPTEIGYAVLPGTEASGAYWVSCDVVYTVDYTRGVDILKFKDAASACQGPLSEQPSSNQPASAPAAHVCSSRRSFSIHVRRARSVRVWVGGRRVRVSHGVARVDLRGRPAGTVAVRIRSVTRDGRVRVERRRYRTCA